MEELDIATVTKRSIQGILALVTRTFFIQIVALIANLLLTALLTPAQFGVYFIVSAAIAFLVYFSDIGLAAALIQKKEQLTLLDLRTTFTIQQILVTTITIIALILARYIGNFYHYGNEGILLFQALVISFFFSSLKTIPSIILERNLRFDKLVIPQIVETLVFNVVVIYFAFHQYGITSFTYAVLARSVAGLITIYCVAPWKIGFGFSKNVAKHLLSFGVPFQTNSFLALLKDDLLLAYLGKVLPIAQVGYIGIAQKWAYTPLRLVLDNVIRITFPSFSRLQHEKEILGKALEKSLFASCFLIFPAVVGLIIMAPYIVSIVPKFHQWQPALFSLAIFSINAAVSSISTTLTNALNAIGKIKTSLKLMIVWTIATWVITPFAVMVWGFNGVAIASVIISLSVVYVIAIAKKYISFAIFDIVKYPLVSSGVMGLLLYVINPFFVHNLFALFVAILFGVLIYIAVMMLLAKKQLVADFVLIKANLLSKHE